jgi:hypothetical protein
MEMVMRIAAIAIAALAGAGFPAKAQDAEFGCKVLLCAAATNPSWPAIPYCVPVMNQLFSMMQMRGFRWPGCSSARTSAPRYEPYQACPEGWRTGASLSGAELGEDVCARPATPQTGRRVTDSQLRCPSDDGGYIISHRRTGAGCIETMARPRNERPYYFDVRNGNEAPTRIWFSLR